MRSAIKKGSEIESGLPLLPDRGRRSRGRTEGLPRLRHPPSCGLFRGGCRLHGVRLRNCTVRRSESDWVRNGLDGIRGDDAVAGTCYESGNVYRFGYHKLWLLRVWLM